MVLAIQKLKVLVTSFAALPHLLILFPAGKDTIKDMLALAPCNRAIRETSGKIRAPVTVFSGTRGKVNLILYP